MQDRIDELQAELREFNSLGRVHQPCNNPLSEELESKSPGMESDPGGTRILCSASPENLLRSANMTTGRRVETLRHTSPILLSSFSVGLFSSRYWLGGGSAVQHEPGGRDDVGAA